MKNNLSPIKGSNFLDLSDFYNSKLEPIKKNKKDKFKKTFIDNKKSKKNVLVY